MAKVSLLIYCKNTDLHAMSAYETVRSILNYPYLLSLKRYRQITLTFAGAASAQARQWVTEFNQHSFQLLNPNKEAFYLDRLAPAIVQDGTSVFVGAITSPDLDAEARLLKKSVATAFLGRLTEVSMSMVWEFLVDAHHLNDDQLKAELRQCIIDTTSYDRGLLVNPIYETFVWQNPDVIYAKDTVAIS